MRKFGVLLVSACLLVGSASANRQGDALVKQIGKVKEPTWIEAKADDKAYEKAYFKERNAWVKKRNALIWKLLLVDPANPKTPELLATRWNEFDDFPMDEAGMAPYAKRIEADIDKVVALNPPVAVMEAASAARIQAHMYDIKGKEAKVGKEIDAFFEKYPTSKRRSSLLLWYSYAVPETSKPAVIRKFLEQFPDDRSSKTLRNTLRQSESIGKPIELKFTDAISGNEWDIAQNRGKVVLIDFWATWCGPCREKMPEMKSLYAKYHGKGLEIVGVSLDEPVAKKGLESLKSYVAKNQIPWPQFYQGNGWESAYSSSWGINGIPCTFLVDKGGNLRVVNEEKLADQIEKLLEEG